MDVSEIPKEIKRFVDDGGRLTQYPSKRSKQLIALKYLSTKLEKGKIYSEKEINQLLRVWHTFGDWAMLRRDMFDLGLIDREPNGSSYWLVQTVETDEKQEDQEKKEK